MLISVIVALPLALLGLSDGVFHFRSRYGPTRGSPT
jgi:hypothetical protein